VSEDYVSDREVFESLENNPNGIRLFEDQPFLEKLRAVAKSYLRSGESFSATIEHDGKMIVAQYKALFTVTGNPIAYVFMIGESAQLYQLRNYRNILIIVITLVYVILWFGIIYVNNRRNKITNMAMRDQLTQSYNRHSFFEFVAKELSRSSRTGMKMSLALIDVDHFKKVNDLHGHGVGDLVLKQIPIIVKSATRGEDVLARYGGEEFIIMMPNTDLEGAKVVAERIRQNMESYEFEYVHQVTISIGLAEKQPEESMDQCIERADKALYRAKENGRNRVEI
jgi:diguanylate cyclase (GGDEF)-like protein